MFSTKSSAFVSCFHFLWGLCWLNDKVLLIIFDRLGLRFCFSGDIHCYLVTKSCLTLCDPMDCSPPGSSVHGISQARILEWGAISFPGDLPISGLEPMLLLGRWVCYYWATRGAKGLFTHVFQLLSLCIKIALHNGGSATKDFCCFGLRS